MSGQAQRLYQVCTRCVMDTSDPAITFDAQGVCNHCHAYAKRAAMEILPPDQAKLALDRIAGEIKQRGRGKDYDCIIGVSGGVDSTMVAYLVRQLGLRPLAIHLDNGWNAELAVNNIEHCVKKLGIDLYTHVIDWEEFRDLQLSLIRASVANIEVVTDHAIIAILFEMATKMNVQYIISGGNIVTEAVMPRSWMYDSRDLRHIVGIHKQFGTVRLKTYPRASLMKYAYYVFGRRIRYLPILNYVQYHKAQAKELIIKELGWIDYGSKHGESIFTKFFQDYILPLKFGMDKRRPHLSTLILSGQVTRSDAVDQLKCEVESPERLKEDLAFFLKKMRLSAAEFDDIIRSPVKTYRDYPSNGWLFAEVDSWAFKLIKRVVRPTSVARTARASVQP
ncbi:MAG: N-acetyl sugar amidotransferase [Vicinamibacterales bacterium]